MDQSILDNTRTLSQWKRLVGSPGEQAARDWIVSRFKTLGIPVSREILTCTDFSINVVFRLLSPLLSIALLISFMCIEFNLLLDWANLIVVILVLLYAATLPRIQEWSFGKQGRLFRRKTFTTENVVGSLDSPAPHATIILMGHYDSKSQTFRATIRVGLFIVSWFWTGIISLRMFIAQMAKLLSFSIAGSIWDVTWVEVLFPCILGGLLLFNSVGNSSPGALDNASAVSVLLDLARYFKERPLQKVNLRFVASAAEELGLYGADAYVRTHSHEMDKDTTYFLVYDSPAMKGPLWLMTSAGAPRKVLCKEVADLLLLVGQKNNIPLRSIYSPFGSATDHVPITRAGLKVGVIAGPIGRVHTSQDTIDFITQEGLERAALLGKAFIQAMDEKFSRA